MLKQPNALRRIALGDCRDLGIHARDSIWILDEALGDFPGDRPRPPELSMYFRSLHGDYLTQMILAS